MCTTQNRAKRRSGRPGRGGPETIVDNASSRARLGCRVEEREEHTWTKESMLNEGGGGLSAAGVSVILGTNGETAARKGLSG